MLGVALFNEDGDVQGFLRIKGSESPFHEALQQTMALLGFYRCGATKVLRRRSIFAAAFHFGTDRNS